MVSEAPQQLLQVLSDEHEEVQTEIAEVKQFWSEVNQLGIRPKYEEMGFRISHLRNLLEKHFAFEEQGGNLESAVAATKCDSSKAKQLMQDHVEFLKSLDKFIARLECCESAYTCWQEVKSEFDEFLKRLEKHEAEETAIVRQACETAESRT